MVVIPSDVSISPPTLVSATKLVRVLLVVSSRSFINTLNSIIFCSTSLSWAVGSSLVLVI